MKNSKKRRDDKEKKMKEEEEIKDMKETIMFQNEKITSLMKKLEDFKNQQDFENKNAEALLVYTKLDT